MTLARHLTIAATIFALWMTWKPGLVLAQKKPGGGTTLVNPAFVYQDNADGGLFLINSHATTKVRLTSSGRSKDYAPTWSPDLNPAVPGHQGYVAFFRPYDGNYIWGDIMAIPSDGSGPAVVLRSYTDFATPPPALGNYGESMSWSPDGSHILYAAEGAIWALKVATGQVSLVVEIGFDPTHTYNGFVHPCCSPDLDASLPGYQGKIAFTMFGNGPEGGSGSDIGLTEVNIDSSGVLTSNGTWVVAISTHDWAESQPVWSPNGQFLALTVRPGVEEPFGSGRRLNVVHVASGISWTAASILRASVRPTWSPDSSLIGFADDRQISSKWTSDILIVDSAGVGPVKNITASRSTVEATPVWNPAWINDLP